MDPLCKSKFLTFTDLMWGTTKYFIAAHFSYSSLATHDVINCFLLSLYFSTK